MGRSKEARPKKRIISVECRPNDGTSTIQSETIFIRDHHQDYQEKISSTTIDNANSDLERNVKKRKCTNSDIATTSSTDDDLDQNVIPSRGSNASSDKRVESKNDDDLITSTIDDDDAKCEIDITISCDGSDTNVNTDTHCIIQYNDSHLSHRLVDNNGKLLHRICICNTKLENHTKGEGDGTVIIHSRQGIQKLLKWIMHIQGNDGDNNSISNHVNGDNCLTMTSELCSALSSASEMDVIQIIIKDNGYSEEQKQYLSRTLSSSATPFSKHHHHVINVEFYISNEAFRICSPTSLGETILSSTIKQKYKKDMAMIYNQALVLQRVLLELFPNSIIRDFVDEKNSNNKSGGSNDSSVITAKMVYNAIDNDHLLTERESQKLQSSPVQSASDCHIKGLLPKLRPYQKSAVKWMVQRERGEIEDRGWEICWLVIVKCHVRDNAIDNCVQIRIYTLFDWKSKDISVTKDNELVGLYNPVTGWLVQSYEEAKTHTIDELNDSNFCIRGGILAESMGLGKTVELLACILSNPCPKSFLARSKEYDTSIEYHGLSVSSFVSDADRRYFIENLNPYLSCFCGNNETVQSLQWIQCSRCGQTMHGVCCGFTSREEVIAYSTPIGSSPRSCSESYCPFCQHDLRQPYNQGLIGSRATLIVTPPAILNQWEREIQRHVSRIGLSNDPDSTEQPLKVHVYPGVKAICASSQNQLRETGAMKMLRPQYLADADGHSSDNPYVGCSRKMRREKKYRVVPSPLISINWWRICLDEAQRIETPTAASAKMVLNLTSQNKWCVSGTPIGKGKMDDLYGLYLFLNSKPFCYKQCFDVYLKPQYRDINERIKHCTFDLLWRSTKKDERVREQMGIPEQVEKKVILSFSSVERHFYKMQYEKTVLAASTATNCGRSSKKKIDELSLHLHRLRAACCHPQVGSSGISKLSKSKSRSYQTTNTNGVLNMAQILDRLIDDAKLKAEESQRIFTLHTNALASLNKLKAEALRSGRITTGSDTEIRLLQNCCDYYFHALEEAEKNSSPSTIVGEAVLTGCSRFQYPNKVVRDGSGTLLWCVLNDEHDSFVESKLPEVWAKLDFTVSTKKINSILVRHPLQHSQNDLNASSSHYIYPKDCVLQVSNAAMGGAFVDAIPFTLSSPNTLSDPIHMEWEWQTFIGMRPNKSKSWRILVKTYYHPAILDTKPGQDTKIFVALEIQLMEPDIYTDNLQRIHIIHNLSSSLTALLDNENLELKQHDIDRKYLKTNLQQRLESLKNESQRLESHYIEAARLIQQVSHHKLEEAVKKRMEKSTELKSLNDKDNKTEKQWSIDLITWCCLYGDKHLRKSLCEHVESRLFNFFDNPSKTFSRRTFPEFHNIDGLNLALNLRLENASDFFIDLSIPKCISTVRKFSDQPSEYEVLENSQCRKCRSDWDQRGPICQMCKIEESMSIYEDRLKDPELNCVLHALMEWMDDNENRLNSFPQLVNIHQRMEKFFEFKTAAMKELEAARLKWRTHFDLLSDVDELNQCKRSMRLSYDDENLFGLTDHERAFIVQPFDIAVMIMDHLSKQAMAEAMLRQSKEKLRFLKNQHLSVKEGSDDNCCTICLNAFDEDRAVLRCGHMYHYSPCIERLLARNGGTSVTCPMRCSIRTKKEDILIASEKRGDDGSRTKRKIEGCWGTKVDRLVSDIMDVEEKAEKSIVFSQWDDMLTIMEHALTANRIEYVRPKAIKSFGDNMTLFRSNNCNVLLMHVKHGAEGLTLVEANHVFMIEPLLNHSIDSQAINRIHRIGQSQKTFVHRYLIEDTIEMKIDKIRVERHENNPDDDDMSLKKTKTDAVCGGGGFDGDFNQSELQELLQTSL